MASIKINEVLQRNDKKKSLFDRFATISKETHVERLKDFVNRRINYILKKPTLEISLKTIMDRLELKFLQVQRLYNHKIALMNEEMKFEVYSERVLHHDVNTLFSKNGELRVSSFSFYEFFYDFFLIYFELTQFIGPRCSLQPVG